LEAKQVTNFAWKVRQIETISQSSLENVVVTVCFDVLGDENGLAGFAQGDVRLLPADASHFTELDNLTEAQVIGWVKDALGAAAANYEARVQAQIDAQKVEQPKVVPLPWA
jgi:hypothetical protein